MSHELRTPQSAIIGSHMWTIRRRSSSDSLTHAPSTQCRRVLDPGGVGRRCRMLRRACNAPSRGRTLRLGHGIEGAAGKQADAGRDLRRIQAEIDGRCVGTDPFAALVRATHMSIVISDPRQADNFIVFVNDAFCRMSGYGPEEIVGGNCRFLQGADPDPAAVERIRRAVKSGERGRGEPPRPEAV